ncbi:TRAP transporter small permease subunit [Mesorhizobium sp. C089B]|uniref:TRAP transporter small permease n=1 Tax=Mesorhizobium sp. C089B TaxID=2956823 RepID=UPI0025778BB5|nr:TRAP transporter small permease subunit [Mesorhizobium sp. C089B]WJI50348.1 TRAP transporter small permease subunit [Mesorhizobium sp. C089B]
MESDTLSPPPAGRGWLVLAFEFVGVAAFVVMFGSTLLSVIARYFEFGGVEWSFEIAGIAFIWITFIGVINAELRGENVAFEALNHSAPARLRESSTSSVRSRCWQSVLPSWLVAGQSGNGHGRCRLPCCGCPPA